MLNTSLFLSCLVSSFFLSLDFLAIAYGATADTKAANWDAVRSQLSPLSLSTTRWKKSSITSMASFESSSNLSSVVNFSLSSETERKCSTGPFARLAGWFQKPYSFRSQIVLAVLKQQECLWAICRKVNLLSWIPDNGFFELLSDCTKWSTRFTIHVKIFNQSKVLQFWLIACYILSENDVECVFHLDWYIFSQDADSVS